MNPKLTAVLLVLVALVWVYLAKESFSRGKDAIALLQSAAAVAFVGRGVFEWRKSTR